MDWPTSIDAHPGAAGLLQAVHDAAAAGLPDDGRLRPEFMAAVRARVGAMATGRPLPDVSATSQLEQAVLSYAETLTLDPHAVTDDDVAPLTAALTPGEVVALTVDIGMADAAARLAALLSAGAAS